MKKPFVFLVLVFLCAFQACTVVDSPTDPTDSLYKQIVGKWSSADEENYIIIFNKDGTADLVKDGVSMTESVMQGRGYIFYSFDAASQPIRLNLEAYTMLAQKIGTLKMIVEFVDEDILRVAKHQKDEEMALDSFEEKYADDTILYRVSKKAISSKKVSLSAEEQKNRVLKHQCNNGRVNSCEQLAKIYEIKADEAKSLEKKYFLRQSFVYQQKACDYGFFYACFVIARYYEEGNVVGKDMNKARQFYQKACNKGYGIPSACRY